MGRNAAPDFGVNAEIAGAAAQPFRDAR
ncbi:hypothetical protein IAE39_004027, partial [Pseudomonas sp. S37]|nr:hypothetical protein [Pseudomonas sp. S37]